MQRYTIAEIAAANEAGGYFFFSKSTMKFFGDTRKSFAVRHIDGKIYVQRVKPAHNAPKGVPMDARLRLFDPETGDIGPHLD